MTKSQNKNTFEIMCHNLGISSVNNLDLTFNNNPSITWSPPSFYSDDIPQESITTYHVIVKSKDGSIIADDNTTNTFISYLVTSLLTVILILSVLQLLLNNIVHQLQMLLKKILEVRLY